MLPRFASFNPSWVTTDQLSPEQQYDSATIAAGWTLPGGGGTMPLGRRMPQSLVDSINMDLESKADILRSTKAIEHIMNEAADDETDLVEAAVSRFDQARLVQESARRLRSTCEELSKAMVDETEISRVTAEAKATTIKHKRKYRTLYDKAQNAAFDADLPEIQKLVYW